MMSANEPLNANDPNPPPAVVAPMARWQKFRLLVRVVELRLRFILLMAITGVVFAYWDSIWNHVDKWMRPQASKLVARSGYEFYCAMHPNVVQDRPGSCPICGMPLTRRKRGQQEVLPEGVLARVQLAPFRIEQAGIRTAEVAFARLTETLTTVGYIVHDETRYSVIASKIKGMTRIEQLYVNYLGMPIEAGQPLAVIYSPELYVATQELLLAQRKAQESPRTQTPTGRSLLSDSKEVFEASVEKFKLWGITQTQIDDILKQGKAQYRMPILAPMSGHVTKKNVVTGQMVPEGYDLFEIADLNDVWVKAQVYEDQIPLVQVGQTVEATVAAFPGDVFPGRVAFIDPELDPATRTIGVRYDLANPGHKLRPGMFATVTLRTPMAEMPAFQARAAAAGS